MRLAERVMLSCQGETVSFSFVFVFVMHGSFHTFKRQLKFLFWETCVTYCEVNNPETNGRGAKIKTDLL